MLQIQIAQAAYGNVVIHGESLASLPGVQVRRLLEVSLESNLLFSSEVVQAVPVYELEFNRDSKALWRITDELGGISGSESLN